MACLRFTEPSGVPRIAWLYKTTTTLGRAQGNDIAVDDGHKGIAQYHAQVHFNGRDFVVSTLDEHAEIDVQGKRKRRLRLNHESTFSLGGVSFHFSLLAVPESASSTQDTSPLGASQGSRELAELGQRLMEATEPRSQLEAILDRAVELTGADKGFVVLLAGDEVEIAVARNIERKEIPAHQSQLSDSVLKKVAETRQALIVDDAVNDSMFASSRSVISLQLSALLCVPLLAQNQLLGLIYLGMDGLGRTFSKAHLEITQAIAGLAALLLQNSRVLDALRADRERLTQALSDQRFGDIIGSSQALTGVFRAIEKVARTEVSVLVTGETGTGKELIAREIHRRSQRREGPLVTINCGAIPENLMESELFGHVRGAFTGAATTRDGKFQAAHGGTLFLDEVGELPLNLQVKLLRVLQDRVVTRLGENRPQTVDIRVIAATHKNLEAAQADGSFREDLFYRLNVINIHLPALRERGEDAVLLAKYFLKRFSTEYDANVRGFAADALDALRSYEWPGNVRQLENRVRKAVVLCEKPLIDKRDLGLEGASQPLLTLAEAREAFQMRYVLEVLERNGGNRTKTARDLDVDPRTIFRYLERQGDGLDESQSVVDARA